MKTTNKPKTNHTSQITKYFALIQGEQVIFAGSLLTANDQEEYYAVQHSINTVLSNRPNPYLKTLLTVF